MAAINFGDYVKVTNSNLKTYGLKGLVIKVEMNNFIVLFSDNKKLCFNSNSLSLLQTMNCDTVVVLHDNNEYLVTPRLTIVSLRTNRIMKWDDNHPTRYSICKKALELQA